MSPRLSGWFSVIIFVLCSCNHYARSQSPEITAAELESHVRFLASDDLEGRASGTEGNRAAAAYIAREFEKYGLLPGGDNGTYFQTFEFVSSVRAGEQNFVFFEGELVQDGRLELKHEVDFRPFGFTTNDTVYAPLVFAGYGISTPDSGYDDYAAINAEGKVVVALRYSPDGNDPHSKFYRHGTFRSKARTAREHGAKGLIIVSGEADDPSDEIVKLAFDQSFANSGIVAISMKRWPFDEILKSIGHSLEQIQDSIRQTRQPMAFDIPRVKVYIQTDVEHIKSTSANVVGYLQGAESNYTNQVLVIGAHMDHLGYGGPGSGSLKPDTIAVHNGADDNASGTAGLLELAEAFASTPDILTRSMVFVAFSGEELGTLGSGHYVQDPLFPMTQTVSMINMDMIGRLEDRSLTIYGTGTSPQWESLLSKQNIDSLFELKLVEDGYGPSDHAQFYGKDVPVLFFFTGIHNDYHKPSDDWEKLNYTGQEQIVRFVYRLARDINEESDRPVFAKVQSKTPDASGEDARPFAVTLGVIPDYGFSGDGMGIGGVRPGGPADKSGIRGGDVIIGINGKKILNIYDYMAILGELKAGDKVTVEVVRDGTRMSFEAYPTKRQ